jgi:hypothetical protein
MQAFTDFWGLLSMQDKGTGNTLEQVESIFLILQLDL